MRPMKRFAVYLVLVGLVTAIGYSSVACTQEETLAPPDNTPTPTTTPLQNVPPTPVFEYDSNCQQVQLDLGDQSEFTLLGHDIGIIYDTADRNGDHFLTLIVDDDLTPVVAGLSNCEELGSAQIHNKDGIINIEGICVSVIEIGDVVFQIKPIAKTNDRDGDGDIGEDPRDEVDNDGDGRMDEDPYVFYWDYSNWNVTRLDIAVFVVQQLEPGQGPWE